MSDKSRNPILEPLSPPERQQIKLLATFLAIVVTAVIIVGIIIAVVSSSLWAG
jgi:hypothetical protein